MAADLRLLVLLLASWVTPAAAQELRPFESGTYGAITEQRAERPFVLAFWSIDCPPCYAELKMFGEALHAQPFDLVLVSTDGMNSAAEVARVLGRFQLNNADVWIFNAPPERLRFEVDRSWYGELPRTYLFSAGQRQAVSGRLEARTLDRWLEHNHVSSRTNGLSDKERAM